jgi:methylmalonyl-CoA mutase
MRLLTNNVNYIDANGSWDEVGQIRNAKYKMRTRPVYYNPGSPERLPEEIMVGVEIIGIKWR